MFQPESPQQFRAMVSYAGFYLSSHEGPQAEQDVIDELHRRFPGEPDAEVFAAMVMGQQSASARADFGGALGGQTLGQIAGLEPGTQVDVTFRTRFGGEAPSKDDEYRTSSRNKATAETTVQQLRDIAADRLNTILADERAGQGWTPDPTFEEQETILFAILPRSQ